MMVVIEQVTLQHLGRCDHRLEPAAHCTGKPQLEKTKSRMRIGTFPKMAKLFYERPGSTHFEIAIEQVPQPGAAPANLATLGNLDPKSVTMRISGLGLAPATYDPETKLSSCPRRLRGGGPRPDFTFPNYGERVWTFNASSLCNVGIIKLQDCCSATLWVAAKLYNTGVGRPPKPSIFLFARR
ncbi:MAG: hypothetical protein WCA06_09815 [Terrimicrobiaceae bacterium]